VSPYFFSTKGEERERKRERKHKRGQKKRAKNLFSSPVRSFYLVFFRLGKRKKRKEKERERGRERELIAPTTG